MFTSDEDDDAPATMPRHGGRDRPLAPPYPHPTPTLSFPTSAAAAADVPSLYASLATTIEGLRRLNAAITTEIRVIQARAGRVPRARNCVTFAPESKEQGSARSQRAAATGARWRTQQREQLSAGRREADDAAYQVGCATHRPRVAARRVRRRPILAARAPWQTLGADAAAVLGVPTGTCLANAAAMVIGRFSLAPGLIGTTLRYVMLANNVDPQYLLPTYVCSLQLPPIDSLSSLGRTLFQMEKAMETATAVQLIRAAANMYEFKSQVYTPWSQDTALVTSASDAGRWEHTLREAEANRSARKNRHGTQKLAAQQQHDARLRAGWEKLQAAAAQGAHEVQRVLTEKPPTGVGSGPRLPCVRVPAVLVACTTACPGRRPSCCAETEAVRGGQGSEKALEKALGHLAAAVRAAQSGRDSKMVVGLAGAIQRLDPSALTLALGRVLEHDVELPSTWATELLGEAHPYLPAVCGVLPRAFTMEMLELWWCEFGHRFDECMRQEANPCRLAMVSRSNDSPNDNDRVYTTSGSRLLRAGLSVPRTEWHEGRTRVREFDLSTALPASDLCLSDVPELTYAELCGYRLPLSPPS